ncbi:hypothetical protein [Streptomyces sp. NPDC091217]|uniref:hypothetical protein n=1 Tax=Streptomyces sp. NPDC091217 TaxID=3365975 RepID=UPI0037F3132C
MNTISAAPAGSLSEHFDSETFALLEAVADGIEIPEFNADLDVVFGTPLDMYEAGELPHERLVGLDEDEDAVSEAIQARHDRLLAAADIAADDPAIALKVRHRLVDVLLPYAAQLRITALAATPLPIAA